ncbi:MAG: riboflavin synthase [Desulfitobacteriaceae bacterium]
MFTGIIEELGTIEKITLFPQSAELTIQAQKVLEQTNVGDSIAVNGVCLTVTRLSTRQFTVDVMAETLAKTSLAELTRGSPVNLERALQLQTRLGGHLLSGHVDGIGRISKVTPVGIAQVNEISAELALLHYILPKGSVAVDGISLTVVDAGRDFFSVSLIPHTFKATTLGKKGIGATVNLETDIIGKYVAKFLKLKSTESNEKGNLSLDFLEANGFL